MATESSERWLEVRLAKGVLPGPAPGRVRVAFKVCSEADPSGAEFASKVSPWVQCDEAGRFSFASGGLRARFPLGRGGPQSLIFDPRFKDSAELLIEVWVSTAPTVLDAAPALWSKVLERVQDPLDQMTKFLNASLRLPLANVLCGRGLAADRALGGWMLLGPDGPRVWMQTFVLPDHADSLPQLEAQLREAEMADASTINTSSTQQASALPLDACGGRQQSDPSSSPACAVGSNAFGNARGPWGPKKSSKPSSTTPGYPRALQEDLLDIGGLASSAATVTPAALPVDTTAAAPCGNPTPANYLDNGDLLDIPLHEEAFMPNTAVTKDMTTSAFAFVGGSSPAQVSAFDFVGAPTASPEAPAQVPATNVFDTADLASLYSSAAQEPITALPKTVATSRAHFSALCPGWSNHQLPCGGAGGATFLAPSLSEGRSNHEPPSGDVGKLGPMSLNRSLEDFQKDALRNFTL